MPRRGDAETLTRVRRRTLFAVCPRSRRRARLGEPDVRGQVREADRRVDAPLLVEDRLAQPVEAEPAAALPAHRLRDAALLPLDDLAQPRHAVRDRVLAQLDADVAPPHLVRHRRGRAGAEEGVEDQVAGVGGDVE